MPASPNLKELVDQMPEPDRRGMYSNTYEDRRPAKGKEKGKAEEPPEKPEARKDVDKERIENAIAEIHKGGRDNILGVIDLLVEPAVNTPDVKAHYALHCLALLVCKLDDKEHRQVFSDALASQLGGSRPKAVQAYLCQELGTAGQKGAAPALGKVLTDPEVCDPAARALVAIREGAAEQLRAALPKASGKCRLNIIQALGELADAEAVEALRGAVSDADCDTRLAAGWALANIGDEGAADLLTKAADAEPGWERIQATKACLLLAEKLLAAGKKPGAVKLYTRLRDSRTDAAERYVRDAAEKALAAAK